MGFRGGRVVDDALQLSRGVSEEVLNEKGDGRVVISLYDIEKSRPKNMQMGFMEVVETLGNAQGYVSGGASTT